MKSALTASHTAVERDGGQAMTHGQTGIKLPARQGAENMMRRHNLRAGLALWTLLLTAGAALAEPAPLPTPTPSRQAEKGCQWRPFDSPSLGLRMFVQECSAENMRYVFSSNGDWIEAHRPSDDATFNGPRQIKVFRKAADQPIEDALRDFFIKQLPSDASASCTVQPMEKSPVSNKDKIVLEIAPTGDYEKKILEELKKEPRDFGCGRYGKAQGLSYFEYHPSEDPTKFLFVEYGFDAPLFDENSLTLYQTSTKAAGAGWVFVWADELSKIFYNPVSKKTEENDIVVLDVLTDYDPTSSKWENFGKRTNGLSEIEKVSFDCENNKYKGLGGKWFEGRAAAGAVKSAYGEKEKWSNVPEFYLKLYDTVCHQ